MQTRLINPLLYSFETFEFIRFATGKGSILLRKLATFKTLKPKLMEIIDLFQTPELLPDNIKAILDKYATDDNDYTNCQNMLAEMEAEGYTFEFGLDAVPFNLQISEIYFFDDWVENMLNSSDYSENEILSFKEHYQNLLTFEQNTNTFIEWHNKKDTENVITYHRQPTAGEIKFGYGATHYKDFPLSQCVKKNGNYKKWLVCPVDGLRYYY